MANDAPPSPLLWATRGRSWGFRFLLDGGLKDPLGTYERAFAGFLDEREFFRADGAIAALRFPDPLGRRDESGRTIPHEFVALAPLATTLDSLDSGLDTLWPLVADVYERFWNSKHPPSVVDVQLALSRSLPNGPR